MARRTVAQLTADLETAHVSYQQLSAKYEALKAEYSASNAQRVVPTPNPTPTPTHASGQVIGRYVKRGVTYEKVVVGHNRIAHRQVC